MVRYDKIEENGGFSMASWITASAPSASSVTHGSPACSRAWNVAWKSKLGQKSVPKVYQKSVFFQLFGGLSMLNLRPIFNFPSVEENRKN